MTGVSAILAKATDRFSETAIDDEVVVMNLDSGDFYSLTGTARTIWLMIDGNSTRDQLVARLQAGHHGESAEITADLDAFLGQLAAAGLLVSA